MTHNKRQIFYSFHFDKDVMRVQQIRNIGTIEGNAPVSVNDWEQVKRGGSKSIENWIEENMKYKNCVVVLVGEDTADRDWVKYEIKKAWTDGRGLVGIYIHNLRCPRNGVSRQGKNPFEQFTINGKLLSSIVTCYNPSSYNAYGDIKNNLERLVEEAIITRTNY